MVMNCGVKNESTPDAFDFFDHGFSFDTTTSTFTTATSTATTELTKHMQLIGSITTAYAFSNDLNDPASDMFKYYAATVESDMTSIMMQSSIIKSVFLRVTGFRPIATSRNQRQVVTDTKAMAEFEANVQVPESAHINDVQGAVEAEIRSASADGFDSLGSDSFNTIGVISEVLTTTTSSTTSTTSTTTGKTILITHDSFFDLHGYHSSSRSTTRTSTTTSSITPKHTRTSTTPITTASTNTPSTTPSTTTTTSTYTTTTDTTTSKIISITKTPTNTTPTTTTHKITTRKAKSTKMSTTIATTSTTTTATTTIEAIPTTPINDSIITSSAATQNFFVSCNSFLLSFLIYVFQ